MRTLSTFAISFLFLTISFANNTNPFAIEGTEVTCTIEAIDYSDIFESVIINEELGQLKFTAKEKIEFVQIMNVNDEIEFQLPINSQKLALDYLDFKSGSYTVHFLINGNQDVVISSFTKK